MSFVEGYLAGKSTLGLDWSAIDGLDWVPYTWGAKVVHSIDGQEYVRWEIHQDIPVVYDKEVILVVTERFNRVDLEAAYWYY